ncbi:hypothetical protein NP552_04570 [Pseudomonas sp. 8209]|uniref:hypothetical protein n=1 Tax=Pseudomonas sp. 8209 TaxID=2967214 RepID=UPI0023637919|nr:hypothetical protein [Pseudomonas sp. 8209]MDD1954314.1 hypothetical protein [Pseudomonas sp. 8209]
MIVRAISTASPDQLLIAGINDRNTQIGPQLSRELCRAGQLDATRPKSPLAEEMSKNDETGVTTVL